MLDGGVNKEERMKQWHCAHRRIFFATPQAFKNDVFTGEACVTREPRLIRQPTSGSGACPCS